MWGKIVLSAAGLLAFALAAFLGRGLILAYGDARRAAGQAEAESAQLPAMLAASAAATRASLAARDNIIVANQRSAEEWARLLPLILAANDKVNSYAQTEPGRAPCLSPHRVRGIEADRAALFSSPPGSAADPAGPMPSNAPEDATRPRPE